jgi:hypothetical protein
MSSELASLMKTLALKIATIVVLVVGAQAVFADGGQTDDDPNSVIKTLCRSKDAEGGYDWKLDGEAARVWVICHRVRALGGLGGGPDAHGTWDHYLKQIDPEAPTYDDPLFERMKHVRNTVRINGQPMSWRDIRAKVENEERLLRK